MSQHLLQQIGPVVPPSDPERAAVLRVLAEHDALDLAPALGLDQPAPNPSPTRAPSPLLGITRTPRSTR